MLNKLLFNKINDAIVTTTSGDVNVIVNESTNETKQISSNELIDLMNEIDHESVTNNVENSNDIAHHSNDDHDNEMKNDANSNSNSNDKDTAFRLKPVWNVIYRYLFARYIYNMVIYKNNLY